MTAVIEGRIIKGVGGLYMVATEDGAYECTARGIFRKRNITPTVGDFVNVETAPGQAGKGSIIHVAPRKNSLDRPRVANVDQVVMVFSVTNPALNPDMLDRFIITAEHRGIPSVLCFSKTDLLPLADIEQDRAFSRLRDMYEKIGYPVALASMRPAGDADTVALRGVLAGKVSVFAGPSGAGKSTLINSIVPGAGMETGSLSQKIQRGRHTTRHTELLQAFSNSFIVDSPGFTALAMDGLTTDSLPYLFREFRPFLRQCRFSDCKHLREPDCAVKEQVGRAIDPLRYDRYAKFMEECQ